MKIRMHRGTLADSMATMEEIQPTREAVAFYLLSRGLAFGPEAIDVAYYGRDERIGWDVHLVTGDVATGDGMVLAMTDGPLDPPIGHAAFYLTKDGVRSVGDDPIGAP